MKSFFLFLLLVIFSFSLLSQNTVITDDENYNTDTTAVLDIYSTSKGVLIPRLTTSERLGISNPAKGLLVFDNEYNSFFYHTGDNWRNLSAQDDTLWTHNSYGVHLYNPNNKVGVGSTQPVGKLEVKGDNTTDVNTPLFNVINSNNDTVFAVYPGGVRINIPDTIIGKVGGNQRGGFAVGGFSPVKAGEVQDFLVVSKDSVRVYIEDNESKVGGNQRGGFAVGGFSPVKSNQDMNYFDIQTTSTIFELDTPRARILWYPNKEAFLTGKVIVEGEDSIGWNSFATGYCSKPIGDYSQAMGYGARAAGFNSTAIGSHANATGNSSMAIGDSVISAGYGAFAYGTTGFDTLTGQSTLFQTKALGDYSLAMGFGSVADTTGAIVFGSNSAALGPFSFSAGLFDTTYSAFSVAMGVGSSTSGEYSAAIGLRNRAQGKGSYAIGAENLASGVGAFTFGYASEASGLGAFSLGAGNTSTGKASFAVGVYSHATADGAFAIGDSVEATGAASLAMGILSTASGGASVAIGSNVQATASFSNAFGASTVSSGLASTAFGGVTTASGAYSTAFGNNTAASGAYSTAFGRATIADGDYSVAMGQNMSVLGESSIGISLSSATYSVSNPNVMSIMGGKVGIGTTAPACAFHVASSAPVARFVLQATSGRIVEFYSRSSSFPYNIAYAGDISVNTSGVVSYNSFTGSHTAVIEDIIEEGMLIELSGKNDYVIDNKKGEIIYGGRLSQKENSSNILGAYFSTQEIKGKGELDLVTAVGNGSMWVIDSGTDLKIGDYLISSSVAGHAVKDEGKYYKANIIARVAEPVNWDRETKEIDGVKHKKISVFYENFVLYHNEKKISDLEKRIIELENYIKTTEN